MQNIVSGSDSISEIFKKKRLSFVITKKIYNYLINRFMIFLIITLRSYANKRYINLKI
ncbi:hypothetical protein CCAND93_360022 [Capnocytophaga canis]|uniref:Uncharacterized protein n=1 Tax=Capnocytophaga canis TaxID=1848903 RepID=A0A0B7ISY3_9FLAO|nr:hypothetical protein CCAND93_360022 [Capnocytophaga canis]